MESAAIRHAAVLLLALAAAAFAAAPAAAAEEWVALYSWGVDPAEVVTDPGDTVHFTNFSGEERRVVDADGLIDSGPLPPAGAFSVAVTVPGEHTYSATGLFGGAPTGTVRVRLTQLPGQPGAPVAAHIPDLAYGSLDASDVGLHPELGILASRTRILLGFRDGTTVAEANRALAAAGVEIRGGLPHLGLLLVSVRDDGTFGPLDAALASLQADPAVDVASMSPVPADEAVPKTAESRVESFSNAPWKWEVLQTPWGAPRGQGGNWGLEASRFPQAWNLLQAVRERQARNPANVVRTGIIDAGFEVPHADLSKLTYRTLCGTGGTPCTQNPPSDHGNHVAGIIGADYDNPSGTNRTTGVSGTNPAALIDGVSFTLGATPNAVATFVDVIRAWDLLLDDAANSPKLRVVNFSVGVTDWRPIRDPFTGRVTSSWWTAARLRPTCGPGDNDDGTGNLWCTPETDDRWRAQSAQWGRDALRVATRASALGVTIVQASGNDSARFCLPLPTKPAITDFAPSCTGAGESFLKLDAVYAAPFAWASRNWTASSPDPVLVVENIDSKLARAPSSNVLGDVSAPGTDILSTVLHNDYGLKTGTSMAAPHVTGLVGYLLAFDPSLTLDQVHMAVAGWARDDQSDGASPRIDAFATLLSTPGAARALVDVNDRSFDGRRRAVLDADNKDTGADTTPITPDDRVDMRDFRAFRDAWLETCEPSPRPAGCPAGRIALNGGATNVKRDLNLDGCVGAADPNCANAVGENVFPRFDFNGDGVIDRAKTAAVPLNADGTPASAFGTDTAMTDLGVLATQFDDPGEGWTKSDLDRLLPSGDLEIHADKLFDAGATSVELSFKAANGMAIPSRTLRPAADVSKQFLVATVPAGTEITLDAVARLGPAASKSLTEKLTLDLGEDRRLDLCKPLALSAYPPKLPADGQTTTVIAAHLTKCRDTDAVGAKPVAITATPATGVTLDPAATTTSASGWAITRLKGTQPGVVHVAATVDLGGGKTATDDVEITLGPKLKIAYVWKQTVDDWWEQGSTRWPDELSTPLAPDCRAAPVDQVPYCIDAFRLELGSQSPDGVVRSGTLTGGGERFTVAQSIANTTMTSKAHWDVTNRRDSTKLAGGRTATWQVKDPNAYADHAMDPGDVAAEEYDDGLHLYGMQWVGDLPYHYAITSDLPANTFAPSEVHAVHQSLMLVPQDPSVWFGASPTAAIVFPQAANGRLGAFQSCAVLERDLAQQKPSWYDPWPDQWGGSAITGRKFEYTPGDRPMPMETGHLKLHYSFAAVAWHEGEPARAPALPDCSTENAPRAAFDPEPAAALEGRQVAFVDRSTDAENDISDWSWSFGDGTTSTEASPHHMFPDDGTYTVTLTVRDAGGRAGTVSHDVTVANLPPEASIDDVDAVAGDEVKVEWQMVDPSKVDKAQLRYAITSTNPNWPAAIEGTEVAGARAIRFPSGLPAGTYPLTLTVTDKEGAQAVAESFLVVAESAPAPCDTSCPPPPPQFTTCDDAVTLDEQEHQFLVLVNAYRAENGLVPVGVSPTLTRAARAHADDMTVHDFFAHAGSDGSTPSDRAWRAGYPEGQPVSENLAQGTVTAFAALQAWKASQTGHNENMLNPAWRAIGIAREQGSTWRWATSYGRTLDCPDVPVDILAAITGAATGAPLVLASAVSLAPEHPPLAALTVDDREPLAKRAVVFHNRARDAGGRPLAATLDPGDGTPPAALGPDEAYTHRYATPYGKTPTLTATDADGRTQEVTASLFVRPLPFPVLQPTGGVLSGFVGKTVAVHVVMTTPAGAPLTGRELSFALGDATVLATTGADGAATATLDLTGVEPGWYAVIVTYAGDDEWSSTQTSTALAVALNHAPVPDTGGPYVVGVGNALLLDGSASYDADAASNDRIVSYEWDVDGDGAFDDLTTATPRALAWDEVRALVCGGVCSTSATYTIGLRLTDTRGDSATATATVRFTSDFALSLGGQAKTVVPGASNSFAVSVVAGGGFSAPVTLSVAGLPAGVTASFSVNPVTPSGISVVTITAGANAAGGSFPLVVTGTGGGVTHTVSDQVDVAFGLIPICYGTIAGTVRDRTTGAVLAGATINVGSTLVTTDANGRYAIHGVQLGFSNAPRAYTVSAIAPGYWQSFVTATVACGAPAVADFPLLAQQQGRIAGTVVVGTPDPANHTASRGVTPTTTPVPSPTITAPGSSTLTGDADGRYAGGLDLNTGNTARFYNVIASAPGYWQQTKSVTVDSTSTKTVDFALVKQCSATIRGGTVRWADTGELVPNARVEYRFSSTDLGSTNANAGGVYDFAKSHLLGVNNSTAFFSLRAFPPAGSPLGSSGQFANVTLADCGSETGADLLITRPKVNRATVEGYALDDETGAPLAGAWVAIGPDGFGTQTDAAGHYRFADLFVGFDSQTTVFKTFSASLNGYYGASASRTLVADTTTRLDLRLLKIRYGAGAGVVKDTVTGVPIPEAEVGCWYPAPFCTVTGRDGRWETTQVVLGSGNSPVTTTVRASAGGYWPQSKTMRFEAGSTTTTDFELLRQCPLARIVGMVVNAETQAPIPGAYVYGGNSSTWTDATGRFELGDVTPGAGNAPLDVWVTASADGFVTASKLVTVFCGATVSVQFGARQSDSGTIVGTVTNADTGKPLAGVFVGSEFGGTATTDAAGGYRLAHVPLGDLNADKEWKVTAVATGFKQQTKAVVVRAGVETRADFAFTVAGNHRPVAAAAHAVTDEDQWVDVSLTGSDADGDGLLYHLMRYPQHGRLAGDPPDLRYYPDPDFNGSDDFAFATSDGIATSETATVDVVVRPVNDNPFAATDFLTLDEGTQLALPAVTLLANDRDVDGDTLSLDSVSSLDYRVSVAQVGGTLLLTPSPGFHGDSTFWYVAGDGHGGSAIGYVNVTVRNVPDAPVCADASFTGTKGMPVTGSLACTDADGDALTYALAGGPAHGDVVVTAAGGFTYTPAAGFRGGDAFTFTATDGTLVSGPATVRLQIVAANEPPVATRDGYAVDEDAVLTVAAPGVLANDTDADGDSLTTRLVSPPVHGTLDYRADGSFTYTPAPNFHGADSFAYRARDDDGEESDTATVAIDVRPVNDAPVCRPVAVTTNEDERASFAPDCSDVDGDALTYDVAVQPAGTARLAIAGAALEVRPERDAHGAVTARYRASDGSLDAVADVAITVVPVNDPPVAEDVVVALDEDAPPVAVDLAPHVADVETADDALTYEIVSQPAHGTLRGTGPLFAYDSDPNANGADSFRYRVVDTGDGGGAPAASEVRTVRLAIAPVNDAPTVELAAAGPVDEGAAPIELHAVAADVDGDALTYTWTGADGDGAQARFAADDGPASATVRVVVTDGNGGRADAATQIDVRNVATRVDAGPDVNGYWGVLLRLGGTATDPSAADIAAGLHATWSFGDGSSGTGPVADHRFADPGAYTAVLAASDKDGGAGEDTAQVTVARRPARLVYAGSTRAPFGSTVLSARLEDAVDAPTARLTGKLVEFSVAGATIIALTDATGTATAQALTTGGTVRVTFAGDALYEPAQTQAELAVDYDFGGAGFFAVADASAAVGATATFWSSDWWKANALADGPAAFKGWVARDGAPACGQAWTTGSGNSADPPATVPRYLAVVVTSAAARSGPDVTGDTKGIVVVETRAGYAPAPGHTGTGTVVARVC